MLDFSPVHLGQLTTQQLVERENVSPHDLPKLTNEMLDAMLALIADCDDAAVTFVPQDPEANDTFASSVEDVDLAWTLGHVIVHVTASAEESAFIAAELARGVERGAARSRYEVPWQSVTTIQRCRARLQESRRMRLASLEMWPQPPHLENTYELAPHLIHNPISRFVAGLAHDDSHLEQIKKIVAQARAARRTEVK